MDLFWDITPITVAAQPAFPRFRCVGCCCLHKGFVCQLKYDAVNDLLFSAGDDGLVCTWNVALVDPMKPHARQNLGEEELLVFALQHGGSFRFGGNSGTSPANSVLFCDLSPDGRFIATGAKDGTGTDLAPFPSSCATTCKSPAVCVVLSRHHV